MFLIFFFYPCLANLPSLSHILSTLLCSHHRCQLHLHRLHLLLLVKVAVGLHQRRPFLHERVVVHQKPPLLLERLAVHPLSLLPLLHHLLQILVHAPPAVRALMAMEDWYVISPTIRSYDTCAFPIMSLQRVAGIDNANNASGESTGVSVLGNGTSNPLLVFYFLNHSCAFQMAMPSSLSACST